MKVTATRALIFYGDITGFSSWGRRVRRERVRDLISDTYGIYDRWQQKYGYWMKKQSDGIIAACDLAPKNDRDKILEAVSAIGVLSNQVNAYLASLVYPRPHNFRIRGVSGDAWRFDDVDGSRDYAGDPLDFGKRLCDIAKDEPIILSEGIFDGVGRKKCKHITFENLSLGNLNLIGVHPEDQKQFYRPVYSRHRKK